MKDRKLIGGAGCPLGGSACGGGDCAGAVFSSGSAPAPRRSRIIKPFSSSAIRTASLSASKITHQGLREQFSGGFKGRLAGFPENDVAVKGGGGFAGVVSIGHDGDPGDQ